MTLAMSDELQHLEGQISAINIDADCDVANDVPISLDEIEPGLFLGNAAAAQDITTLKALNIKRILTVDSCPLPKQIIQLPWLINKYIQISDLPKEDFLQYFPECIQFIVDSIENENVNDRQNILVHCYHGVSRSSTIVIAYIMQKYKISYQRAFEKAKTKRRFIGPNSGFIIQLRIFHQMKFKLDPTVQSYKIYKLKLAGNMVKRTKYVPQSCLALIKPDPGLQQVNPVPSVFKCRKCRRPLATKNDIVEHRFQQTEGKSPAHNMKDGFKPPLIEITQSSDSSNPSESKSPDICHQMIFVEPIAWMGPFNSNIQSTLFCPKCSQKVGYYNWTMGCRCPCGANVSPAFYLVPSKVELSTVVQNVQTTI